MSATFHFAIPAGDLSNTERFYVEVLGCATGNREVGRWVDIDFDSAARFFLDLLGPGL